MTWRGWGFVMLLLTVSQPLAAGAPAPEPALAATPQAAAQAPQAAAVQVPLPAALEQEARQIEHMVIAPCCWMQPVSDHQSQASDEVKQQIRQWLGSGMTRQQVLDAFVARYGARILAEPPNQGFSRFLYLTPWVVFGVSGIGLVALVKKMTGTRTPGSAAPAAPPEPRADANGTAYEEQLDDELRDME